MASLGHNADIDDKHMDNMSVKTKYIIPAYNGRT